MNQVFPKCCFDRFLPEEAGLVAHGAQRMAALTDKLWSPGDEITYSFMTPPSIGQITEVRAAFLEWGKHVNIVFARVQSGGMVRISFDPRGGAWSMVGRDCLSVPKDQPTMNLGFNHAGTYLHEIGHLLGCIHEHQHPEGGIQWNRNAVIRDLSGPPNHWNMNTINNNMFHKYSRNQINGSAFDPQSIMMYAFPKSWTMDGFSTGQNEGLSEQDIAHIKKLYPEDTPLPGTTDDPIAAVCPELCEVIQGAINESPGLSQRKIGERITRLVELFEKIQGVVTPENIDRIKQIMACIDRLSPQEFSKKAEALLRLTLKS